MFFHNRIKSIQPGDKVLEIGPGITPFHRSDVFLELKYEDEKEFLKQLGDVGKLVTDKPIVYYDGKSFPFKDKEFDYIICSHVLEHVPDVPFFLEELKRVGKKGYLEYPTVYYEQLFNLPVHLNFLMFKNDTIYYLEKSNSNMNSFNEIQYLFKSKLDVDPPSIIGELMDYFFQGFEWEGSINYKKASTFVDICFDRKDIVFNKPIKPAFKKPSFKDKVKIKLKLLIDKI